VVLAQELFERALDDSWGTFSRADETYVELLGDAGLAEYRRLAEAAYQRLPPVPRASEDRQAPWRDRLVPSLTVLPSAQGWGPRWLCQTAQDGAWLFEDHSTTPLIEFLAERLVAEGRKDEAVAALRRGFEQTPSFSLVRAQLALDVAEAADHALEVPRASDSRQQGGPLADGDAGADRAGNSDDHQPTVRSVGRCSPA
jgi:hypothetical protein